MTHSLQQFMAAHKALREGVATKEEWGTVTVAVMISMAIERLGYVVGMREHLASAHQALQNLFDRATDQGARPWVATAMEYYELDTLQTFSDLHQLQFRRLQRHQVVHVMAVVRDEIARMAEASEGVAA